MMKRRLIFIGIFVLVSALLAVGMVILSGIEPLPQEEDPDYQFGFVVNDEKIRVFNFSSRNIDFLQIENSSGTYRVRKTDGAVQIVGFESIPLLAASSEGLFNSGETLRLETVIAQDCQNLGEFGLAEPKGTVTIQAYSGATAKFHIGNPTPNPGYYYMCIDGETTVYLIDELLAARYLKSISEYCDRKIYKTFVPAEDFVALSIKSPSMEYSFRQATEEEIVSSGIYFLGIAMEKPFVWGGDSAAIEDSVMTSMMELTATSVISVGVTEADLAQYGLDEESCTKVVLSVLADPNPSMYNNKTNPYFDSTKPTGTKSYFDVGYRVGKVVDDQVYVMFDNREVVYTMPRETFYWLQWTPYRFCAKLLFGEYLSDMETVTVKTPEETWEFVLKNAASNDKDELRVQCNGKTVDQQNFRTFYSNLLFMTPSGEGIKPEGAEPDLELIFDLVSDRETVIRFYAMDARNYAVEVDGVCFLSVRVNLVEKVVSDVEKLLNGQPIM